MAKKRCKSHLIISKADVPNPALLINAESILAPKSWMTDFFFRLPLNQISRSYHLATSSSLKETKCWENKFTWKMIKKMSAILFEYITFEEYATNKLWYFTCKWRTNDGQRKNTLTTQWPALQKHSHIKVKEWDQSD